MDNFDENAAKEKQRALLEEQAVLEKKNTRKENFGAVTQKLLPKSGPCGPDRKNGNLKISQRLITILRQKARDAKRRVAERTAKNEEERKINNAEIKSTEPKFNTSNDFEEDKEFESDSQRWFEPSPKNKPEEPQRNFETEDVLFEEEDVKQIKDYDPEEVLPDRVRRNTLYKICYIICTHTVFSVVIIILILANTIVLAMDRYPIKKSEFESLGKHQ